MSKAGHYCSGDFTSDEEQRKRTARTSSTTWSPTTWGRGHWTWGHGSGRPADRPKRSMSSLMSCFRCSVEMEVGSRIFAASLTVRITVSFPRSVTHCSDHGVFSADEVLLGNKPDLVLDAVVLFNDIDAV